MHFRRDWAKLISGALDLVIAMGTWAGQDLAVDGYSVPVTVLSTSDPVGAGIIKSAADSDRDRVTPVWTPTATCARSACSIASPGLKPWDCPCHGPYLCGPQDIGYRKNPERGQNAFLLKGYLGVGLVCLFALLGILTIEFFIRKQSAQQEIRESEEKFRTVVTHMEEILWMIDGEGRFILSQGRGDYGCCFRTLLS